MLNHFRSQPIVDTTLKDIQEKTQTTLSKWKCVDGWAPDDVSENLESLSLDWMIDMTRMFCSYTEQYKPSKNAELIIAYTILGSLVESWMKFFLVIYKDDYRNSAKGRRNFSDKNNKIINADKLTYERMKVLFNSDVINKKTQEGQNISLFLEEIQRRRNSIHFLNYHCDLGNGTNYVEYILKFKDFIQFILNRLPKLPECEYMS